jgi:hypothetical protein
VQAHADLERADFLRPSLDMDGSLACQRRDEAIHYGLKDGVNTITCGFDDLARILLHGGSHDFVVPWQSKAHLFGMLFPQVGAIFQIGKEKGQGCGHLSIVQ